MPQPHLFSLIDKAVYDYKLIEKGDNILIGASGGKDSTALIEYFANRYHRPNENFSFTAMHIKSEFSGGIPQKILDLFTKWQINYSELEINIQERVKDGQKMSCYWCSTQRRTELIHIAMEKGFNKLCLGHHMDDILETLLMNCLEKGELSTMPPRLKYNKYPLTIIRPLCYTPVEEIIAHAENSGYAGWTCTCNFQDNSGRKNARSKLEILTNADSKTKSRFFNALKNIKKEYLP